jgi:hypothetical protein
MNTCTICHQTFKTPQGLQGHRRLKHGQGQPAVPPSNSQTCFGDSADDESEAAGAALAARLGVELKPADDDEHWHVFCGRPEPLGNVKKRLATAQAELAAARAELHHLCQDPACQVCQVATKQLKDAHYFEILRLIESGGGPPANDLHQMAWRGFNLQAKAEEDRRTEAVRRLFESVLEEAGDSKWLGQKGVLKKQPDSMLLRLMR